MLGLTLRLLAGFFVFITGIVLMHTSLQEISGSRMKFMIRRLAGNIFSGLLLGTLLTAAVQSSSAIIVAAIGLANAGILPFKGVVSIIYGANIGTTITIQILSFQPADYVHFILALGFVLVAGGKLCSRAPVRYAGWVVIAFGFIFLGMEIMEQSIGFLKQSRVFAPLLFIVSGRSVVGVLSGALLTAVFQSSSAITGIIIMFVQERLFGLETALPIILGCNIGTCATAFIATIGGNVQARRTMVAHFLFNLVGTVIFVLVLPSFLYLIRLTALSPARQLANAHTLFNTLNTLLFLPFTALFIRLIEFLVRSSGE